jgi:hypothetical protein
MWTMMALASDNLSRSSQRSVLTVYYCSPCHEFPVATPRGLEKFSPSTHHTVPFHRRSSLPLPYHRKR